MLFVLYLQKPRATCPTERSERSTITWNPEQSQILHCAQEDTLPLVFADAKRKKTALNAASFVNSTFHSRIAGHQPSSTL
jgi:hypothetical protein